MVRYLRTKVSLQATTYLPDVALKDRQMKSLESSVNLSVRHGLDERFVCPSAFSLKKSDRPMSVTPSPVRSVQRPSIHPSRSSFASQSQRAIVLLGTTYLLEIAAATTIQSNDVIGGDSISNTQHHHDAGRPVESGIKPQTSPTTTQSRHQPSMMPSVGGVK